MSCFKVDLLLLKLGLKIYLPEIGQPKKTSFYRLGSFKSMTLAIFYSTRLEWSKWGQFYWCLTISVCWNWKFWQCFWCWEYQSIFMSWQIGTFQAHSISLLIAWLTLLNSYSHLATFKITNWNTLQIRPFSFRQVLHSKIPKFAVIHIEYLKIWDFTFH